MSFFAFLPKYFLSSTDELLESNPQLDEFFLGDMFLDDPLLDELGLGELYLVDDSGLGDLILGGPGLGDLFLDESQGGSLSLDET